MNIISCSRRTDIPAFYTEWLMQRLRAGSAAYPNPFSSQVYTVSLRPEDVHSIVFWSKHYAPLLPHLDELDERGYRYYFHYTVTGAPHALEPRVPPWEQAVTVFRRLAARTGPRQVQWRFDPILCTADWGPAFHLERFREIAEALAGATERCYFSFAVFYGKVKRRLQDASIVTLDLPLEDKHSLVDRMAAIAAGYGITLHACCQDALVDARVQKARCVDGDLLAQLFPDRPHVTQLRPTREQCGCVASRDIGMYDTCPFGCVYCYANKNHATVQANYQTHDSTSAMLSTRTPNNYAINPNQQNKPGVSSNSG